MFRGINAVNIDEKGRFAIPTRYRERLNSDSRFYGGSDVGNALPLQAEPVPCMGQPWSVALTLPPLAGVILRRDPG